MAKGELLKLLEEDFRDYPAGETERTALKSELAFWEKIASAQQYGLVEAHVDFQALENLRELVAKVEVAETIR